MFDSKEICKINSLNHSEKMTDIVVRILSEIIILWKVDNSIELGKKIKQILVDSSLFNISVADAIFEICNIASIPTSEESGFDGIDMLAKEINPYQCKKIIDIFGKIEKRHEQYSK